MRKFKATLALATAASMLLASLPAQAWVASRTAVGPNGGVYHAAAAGAPRPYYPPPRPYYPPPPRYDHPIAAAAVATAAVVTTAAVTSAVIGSIVHSVPSGCTTVVVNGLGYQQCGSTWYQPQYAGTTVQYIVVNPPR
ncbi:hypothetical protein JHS3_31640 [Jeongeupia sp. HS-3]|uniref:hypothetical protein n=1 Tax=Jeongeupia sp. HS-3 TaxID=1009682 RepID=UPI0018A51973|nr:hypothetical protein [Jeongeupia sp. HS-3]BCL77428.1 hypothetical protein JHS3_31640 [Jeongeupia sp. HS-3]